MFGSNQHNPQAATYTAPAIAVLIINEAASILTLCLDPLN